MQCWLPRKISLTHRWIFIRTGNNVFGVFKGKNVCILREVTNFVIFYTKKILTFRCCYYYIEIKIIRIVYIKIGFD